MTEDPTLTAALYYSAMLLACPLTSEARAQTAPLEPQIRGENEVAQLDQSDAIIVTANKREQAIGKVGLAITALGSDALETQQISSLSDLAAAVPGLSYANSPTQTPVYTLRGVGFYEFSLAAYPTTSLYVDEVPLPFPVMTKHANFDLARVEVLKGPQGTLFGQNSTGGAINFIAAKPTSNFEAGGRLSFGRFNRLQGDAHVSGALTDTLAARLALSGAHGDDWQYSYTRDDTLGETGYYAGRLLLDWTPTERVKFSLNLTGWRDKSDPQAPQYQTLLSQVSAATLPALRAYPFAPLKSRVADWSPTARPFADNRLLQPSLRGDWEISNDIVLTTISSYADYKQRSGVDNDGTTLGLVEFYRSDGRIKSFNQELRISNAGSSTIRWVAGANYEKSHVLESNQNDFSQVSTAVIYGYTGNFNRSDQRMRNFAFFANAEYDIAGQLTLKAGGRYTNARRNAANCTSDPGDNSFASVFENLTNAIQLGFVPVPGFTPTGQPVAPIGAGCAAIDDTTADGSPATYLPGEFHGRLKEDNISWRIGLDYQISQPLLAYVNVAKGYKAGSYPIAPAATFRQYAGVNQESLLSFESGFKFYRSQLQLSGTAFYYKYRDKQLRAKYLDPLFGTLDTLVNVPKSRMIGAELELAYSPIDGLTLGASAIAIDSKITDYIGLNTAGQTIDYSGSSIPYTPKYEGRFTVDYQWEAGSISPFVGGEISARSRTTASIGGAKGLVLVPDFNSSVATKETYTIPGYALVNLRAGVDINDGRWRIMAFGKNVLNKYYVMNIFTVYDTISRYAGEPATYGVMVSFKY